MAGGKETPRQKMIGMMYLVLTALLALNVSKEILDAFILVDNGLRKTENTLDSKNRTTMSDLDGKYQANKAKVLPFKTKAQAVSDSADALIDYLEEMKARTMASSHGGSALNAGEEVFPQFMVEDESNDQKKRTVRLDEKDDEGNKYVKKPDENQENTAMLVGSSPINPKTGSWTANELKEKLLAFKEFLKSVQVDEVTGKKWKVSDQKAITTSLDSIFQYNDEIEQGDSVKWEAKNFYHSPLAAIIPIMTKLQVDVQNAKADVLTAMLAGIEGKSYKFTNLDPLVKPKSTYVLQGDTIRAEVLLAAYDATNPPKFWLSANPNNPGDSVVLTKDEVTDNMVLTRNSKGFGEIKIPTSSLGTGSHTFSGRIEYDGPEGVVPYNFTTPVFEVQPPSLVVSPTRMNVFYRGVDNPVEISVPGVSSNNIRPDISGGHQLTPSSDGGYIVRPGKSSEAIITVQATMPDGTTQNMGKKEFRVKRIPDPVPSFGRKTPYDNTIDKGTMVVQPGILAEMDNFQFDVSVKVVEFKMVFIRDGQIIEKISQSNRVTEEMKANMERTGRGQKFFIEDIKVKMPDGEIRKVPNISLKVI